MKAAAGISQFPGFAGAGAMLGLHCSRDVYTSGSEGFKEFRVHYSYCTASGQAEHKKPSALITRACFGCPLGKFEKRRRVAWGESSRTALVRG